MKTLCYFIEATSEFDFVLNSIIERIPCFVDWHLSPDDENYLVVSVTCREADCAFVERMLTPFV